MAVVLLMVLAPLMAQSPSGTISGVVSDASGAVVPGAGVRIVNADTNVRAWSGGTNQEGAFLAPMLNVGSYNIFIEAPGFKKFEILAFMLEVNQRARVDAVLQTGELKEVVTVTGESVAVLNKEDSAVGLDVSPAEIRDIPLANRDIFNLLNLSAGVSATGAAIAAVMDSGTSRYHGGAYQYFRNEALNANNFSNNLRGAKRPYDRQNQFGAKFSGPFLLPRVYHAKGRTFFFANYEGNRRLAPANNISTLPVAKFARHVRRRHGSECQQLREPGIHASRQQRSQRARGSQRFRQPPHLWTDELLPKQEPHRAGDRRALQSGLGRQPGKLVAAQGRRHHYNVFASASNFAGGYSFTGEISAPNTTSGNAINAMTVANHMYSRIDLFTGKLLVAGKNASESLNQDPPKMNLGPRVGLAYALGSKTVIRSAFGIFFYQLFANLGGPINFPGFTLTQLYNSAGRGVPQAFSLSQGVPLTLAPNYGDPFVVERNATPSSPLAPSAQFSNVEHLPENLQWNFGIQREIARGTVVDVSYVGSHAYHLPLYILENTLPSFQIAEFYSATGLTVTTQTYRKFPNLTSWNSISNVGSSEYDALQVKVTREVSRSVSVMANYTFAKAMDDGSGTFTNTQPAGFVSEGQLPQLARNLEHAPSAPAEQPDGGHRPAVPAASRGPAIPAAPHRAAVHHREREERSDSAGRLGQPGAHDCALPGRREPEPGGGQAHAHRRETRVVVKFSQAMHP
jgi:hypothetical protein